MNSTKFGPNLIYNAIQVMNNQDALKITIFPKNEHAVVQITDSGCGIVAEIQDRIFKFLQTKGMGEVAV